jgi:putative Mn2+ efflux pump MntP
MPMLGWLIIKTLEELFGVIVGIVPFAALALLWFIGIKMIVSGIRNAKNGISEEAAVTPGALLVQGIATSIDALSAGLAFSEYGFLEALLSALIIAAVTFGICTAGVLIGKKAGAALSGKATVVGGVILVVIGAEIFIKGIL